MKKKIVVITGSRSEYGLLKPLLEEINKSDIFKLQLVVTGSHLSSSHGTTISEIISDGYKITKKVNLMLSSDRRLDTIKSMSIALSGFADALKELSPDLVLLLGDRFEIFMAASAAMIFGKPIAHIHGGEVTNGAFDDSIRHSITKMSHIHFVSTEKYKSRVVQLGESPSKVFNVGSLGVESIHKLDLLEKSDVEDAIDFELGNTSFLVTYHPVTIDSENEEKNIIKLFKAIKKFQSGRFIFTLPNADPGHKEIAELIKDFADSSSSYKYFESLGQHLYLSCMKNVTGVIGNSSSGIIEAPSFKIGTINIGKRQSGRIFAPSIINCAMDSDQIFEAIKKITSSNFTRSIKNIENPYEQEDTSVKILDTLKIFKNDFASLVEKEFYDLP